MSKNTLQMRLNFQKRYPVIRNYYYCSRKILRSIASLQDKLLYRLNSVWNSIGRSSWTTSDLFWVYIVDTGHTKKTNKSLCQKQCLCWIYILLWLIVFTSPEYEKICKEKKNYSNKQIYRDSSTKCGSISMSNSKPVSTALSL